MKLEDYLAGLRGKRVAVVGVGVSNTPLITLLMVALAYHGAQSGINAAIAAGAPAESLPQLHFLPMFLHSLGLSLLVGYVLIFVLQPLFLRLLIGIKASLIKMKSSSFMSLT